MLCQVNKKIKISLSYCPHINGILFNIDETLLTPVVTEVQHINGILFNIDSSVNNGSFIISLTL